jgi:hypothetical protein
MNKIFTFLSSVLILANITFAGDRMVLVERFTSWTCGPCAANNPTMDAFLSSQDPEKIVGIAYHMNWPAPGNDGFYHYNPGDNTTRRTYYGVNSIPQARMDGVIDIQPPYSQSTLMSYFNTRTNLLGPLTIIVTDSTYGDSVLVRARIYCEVMLSNPTVTVQFALIEKHIHYTSPPGTNGETDFYDVMRKMPATASGQQITMFPGNTYVVERRYYKDPIWNQAQMRTIVFLQQGLEVFNAAMKTANFTLIPVTGYKAVLQGQNQSASYQMEIPIVSSGYNSPVTLSAQVDPPNAGITVSFPNGNVISSFPASFNVQVNSNSSVPTDAYRIIVTGTNTNSKVHKTSVSYLVGQNFIGVAANRSNLQFRVDNQNYTNAAMFTWDLGASHTLTAISPQTFGSVRYRFLNWSDNGDSSHQITVNTTTTSYTVNYKTQFRLVSSVTPSGLPATVVGGNIFYDSASSVTFSITPLQLTYNGREYYFNRWNGVGNGSYSGTEPSYTIQNMNNIIVETAVFDTIPPIGIQNLNNGVPKSFALHQNYPNPFNPVTKIKFDIPKTGLVVLKIYDILGNQVAILNNGVLQAGYYEAELNASNYASGVYFYRLEAGDFSSVKRMILIK